MKIVSLLVREQRLLLLCAVSAALHLLALRLVAAPAERFSPGATAPRIAVTLLAPAAGAPAAAAAPRAVAAAPTARPAPRLAAHSRSAPGPTASAPPAPSEPALSEPIGGAGWNAVAAVQGEAPLQMPGRYQVRLPPPALLSYAVTRGGAGQATSAAGEALLDWRIGAGDYSLRVEGVAGALTSKGSLGDAGIVPESAAETLADDTIATTRFEDRRIVFGGSARSYRVLAGSQDRASLLLQLAGMGLAEPDQFKDVLEFYVGGAADAGVVRFQVLGPEELDSALGKLASMHLVQLVEPGQARLEVWLAPARHWLPVQLRVTAPDGSVLTQLVSAISER